jgi:hypothetical protein
MMGPPPHEDLRGWQVVGEFFMVIVVQMFIYVGVPLVAIALTLPAGGLWLVIAWPAAAWIVCG